jgi:hypothetical protein
MTLDMLTGLAMPSLNHEAVVSLLSCMASTTRESERDVALVVLGM